MPKPAIDTGALGVLFESLRAFADALPDDTVHPHHRLFLELLADRGDELIAQKRCGSCDSFV